MEVGVEKGPEDNRRAQGQNPFQLEKEVATVGRLWVGGRCQVRRHLSGLWVCGALAGTLASQRLQRLCWAPG